MSSDKALFEPIINQLAFVMNRNTREKEEFLREYNKLDEYPFKRLDSVNNYIYQACIMDFSLSSNYELDEIIKAIVFDLDKEDLKELVDTMKDFEEIW